MPSDGYVGTLVTAQTAGPALTGSTTITSILQRQAKWLMPAGFIDTIGKSFRMRATGRISTVVTTPGTLTLTVWFNATPIVVSASQAFALNIVAKSAVSWMLDLDLVVRATATGSATSANIMGNGVWTSEAVIGSPLPSAGGVGTHMWQASSPAVGTGFDTSVANVVDLAATWSINNANSITCETYTFESLN